MKLYIYLILRNSGGKERRITEEKNRVQALFISRDSSFLWLHFGFVVLLVYGRKREGLVVGKGKRG